MQSVDYTNLWKILNLLQNNISMWYKWKIFQKWFLETYCILIDLDCGGEQASKQASTRELGGKLSDSLIFLLFLFPFMICF
jgi:hypothetical protein